MINKGNKNIIKRKEIPEFSITDFKDFAVLFSKLKKDPHGPIYKNLSSKTKLLMDEFISLRKISRKRKISLCADFNRIIDDPRFYKQLVSHYDRRYLEKILSLETKQYIDSLIFLNKSAESLRKSELFKIKWLNLYILIDIYSPAIYKIQKKGALRAWSESAVFALILVTFLRTFFFQIYKIPTKSMVPILLPNDKIFVTKLAYGPKIPFTSLRLPGFGRLKRAEVVVFVPPQEARRPWYKRRQFVKRLIGLPGERVFIASGNIYVNGRKVVDPRIEKNYYENNSFLYGYYATAGREIQIPPNKYFFLGDNSQNSQDSRKWGYVDEEWIVGRALFIWWPPKRISKIR